MSSFIDQTHISKENPSARHKNNMLKQKAKTNGKGGGLKVRKPLGQINTNVGTTLKHIQNENNIAKKQQQHPKKYLENPSVKLAEIQSM